MSSAKEAQAERHSGYEESIEPGSAPLTESITCITGSVLTALGLTGQDHITIILCQNKECKHDPNSTHRRRAP